MTANYILLKTLKCINLAVDCGLAQYLGCLLEGGCRHKAVCLKGSSCDTLENLAGCCRNGISCLHNLKVLTFKHRVLISESSKSNNLAGLKGLRIACVKYNFLVPKSIVLLVELQSLHKLLRQEAGVTRINNLYLTHHLADNNFKVFVVNLNALHTVNLLNLIHNILLNLCRTKY